MRFKGKKPIASYKDTWDLDMVLSPIIGAGLVKFRDVTTNPECVAGFPSCITEGNYEHSEEEEQIYLAKWHAILDDMVYAFTAKEPEMPDSCLDWGKKGILEVLDKEAYTIFKEEDKLHWERVTKGHEYFGKYFRNLWW